MMYRLGTHGAAAGGMYQVTLTVVNNGAPAALSTLELVMPATVDPNVSVPQMVSATVNGVNQTANWNKIRNQNGTGRQCGRRTRPCGPNAFALFTTVDGGDAPRREDRRRSS